ncbi:hypothetical protein [Nocardioides sp. YIM 152588]|uniref:hypothetical protein n=1 Tax=Nocardioides sp. YIM 152588 TaxID=3158259 RepID=UPI0032E45E9C
MSVPASSTTGAGTVGGAPVGVASSPSPEQRRRRRVAVGLALVVAVAALLTWNHARHPADVRDGTTALSRAELAAAEGVDVNLVAVTAAGGLVELRMQVVDPEKAYSVLHDDDRLPVLVAESTGETLRMASPPHHQRELDLGGTYFFLLANAHDALHAGSEVTLVIGDSRLEHVEVQG